MPKTKRTTVYLRAQTHRALKVQAALTDQSISEIVEDAVTQRLEEDARDAAIIRKRRHEPTRPYLEFLRELKRERRL